MEHAHNSARAVSGSTGTLPGTGRSGPRA